MSLNCIVFKLFGVKFLIDPHGYVMLINDDVSASGDEHAPDQTAEATGLVGDDIRDEPCDCNHRPVCGIHSPACLYLTNPICLMNPLFVQAALLEMAKTLPPILHHLGTVEHLQEMGKTPRDYCEPSMYALEQ